jgi:hypothetical protein
MGGVMYMAGEKVLALTIMVEVLARVVLVVVSRRLLNGHGRLVSFELCNLCLSMISYLLSCDHQTLDKIK